MLRVVRPSRREEHNATSDRVVLADGRVIDVPRADLNAAKALLAAEKAAQRRVAAARASQQEQHPNHTVTA